jgi:hypothetical protein
MISAKGHAWRVRPYSYLLITCVLGLLLTRANAQGMGTSGELRGQVTDPTGAVVRGATVEIHNPVSGYGYVRSV